MTEGYWYRRDVEGSWGIDEVCVHKLSCSVGRSIGDNSTEYVHIACKNCIGGVDIRHVVAKLSKIWLCSF